MAKESIRVSEKIVRRIMSECGLKVKCKRKNKYNSYKGKITPAVPNIIARDFHADAPNQKWLTDITEFAIPAGKVYLSPTVDCFDGMIPAWRISSTPDATLVNDMLDDAVCTLDGTEHPLYILTEAVTTAGPAGYPEWKLQDFNGPCRRKVVPQITLPVKDSLND